MKAARRQQCEEVLGALRDLYAKGVMPAEVLNKGIFCMAYEYLVDNEVDEALALILEIPVSYFGDTQWKQCLEDPEYAHVCVEAARLLEESGVVNAVRPAGGKQWVS